MSTFRDWVLKPAADASMAYLPAAVGCAVRAIGSDPEPYWPSSGAAAGSVSEYAPPSRGSPRLRLDRHRGARRESLRGARFLAGKKSGLYDMQDVLGLR